MPSRVIHLYTHKLFSLFSSFLAKKERGKKRGKKGACALLYIVILYMAKFPRIPGGFIYTRHYTAKQSTLVSTVEHVNYCLLIKKRGAKKEKKRKKITLYFNVSSAENNRSTSILHRARGRSCVFHVFLFFCAKYTRACVCVCMSVCFSSVNF